MIMIYDNDIMDIVYEGLGIIDDTIDIEENYYDEDFISEFSSDFVNKLFSNRVSMLDEDVDLLLEAAEKKSSDDLKKAGLKDSVSKQVSSEIKKSAKKISKSIKDNGLNKTTRKTAAAEFKRFHEKVNSILSDENSWWFDAKIVSALERAGCKTQANIHKACSLVIWCMIINTISQLILTIILGPVGNLILGSIVAPIVEENAKQQAIKYKFTKEFTIIFNLVEASNYIINYGPLVGFVKIVIARLAAVGLHLTTTFIQWITNNTKALKALGINEDDEDKKEKVSFIGHIIGLVIHGTWNFVALASS